MVTLSGGNLGGQEVDGSGWEVGEERQFSGLVYRRVSDTQAIYVGEA